MFVPGEAFQGIDDPDLPHMKLIQIMASDGTSLTALMDTGSRASAMASKAAQLLNSPYEAAPAAATRRDGPLSVAACVAHVDQPHSPGDGGKRRG